MLESLRCTNCDRIFLRPKARGRKPLRCPSCELKFKTTAKAKTADTPKKPRKARAKRTADKKTSEPKAPKVAKAAPKAAPKAPRKAKAKVEKAEAPKVTADPTTPPVKRPRYVHRYTLLKTEKLEEGDKLLFVPTVLFEDLDRAVKYAKPVVFVSVDDEGTATVKIGKETATTKASNLFKYEAHRVEVTEEPEVEEVDDE